MSSTPPPPPSNTSLIFPNKVLSYTSESEKYPSSNILGPKTMKKEHTLEQKGWCPSSKNKGKEIITLQYPKEVLVTEIHILESFHPGSIVKIYGKGSTDKDWHLLWKALGGPIVLKTPRTFIPLLTFPRKDFMINQVRIEMNLKRDCDETQIVSVMLKQMEQNENIHITSKTVLFPDIYLVQNDVKYPMNKMVLALKM